jgi:hypothetical protein
MALGAGGFLALGAAFGFSFLGSLAVILPLNRRSAPLARFVNKKQLSQRFLRSSSPSPSAGSGSNNQPAFQQLASQFSHGTGSARAHSSSIVRDAMISFLSGKINNTVVVETETHDHFWPTTSRDCGDDVVGIFCFGAHVLLTWYLVVPLIALMEL